MEKKNKKCCGRKTKQSKSGKQYRKPEVEEVEFTVKADPSPVYAPY